MVIVCSIDVFIGVIWRFATYYMMLVIGGLVFLYAKTRKDIPIKEES